MNALLTSAQNAEHHDRVPDGVPGEQRNGVAGLEAMVLDEAGRDMGRGLLDLLPIHPLAGDGVSIACKVWLGILR